MLLGTQTAHEPSMRLDVRLVLLMDAHNPQGLALGVCVLQLSASACLQMSAVCCSTTVPRCFQTALNYAWVAIRSHECNFTLAVLFLRYTAT